MSTIRRPGITVNGVHRTRTYHYYWCRHCQRSIRTTTTDPTKSCVPVASDKSGTNSTFPGLDPSWNPAWNHLQARVPEPPGLDPAPVHRPGRQSACFPPGNNLSPDNRLEQFVQELTQNDRPGPPAAPESAIRALPVVELTTEHLKNDSCCPVCKDEFAVGVQVKELPCRHFYHSECIIPGCTSTIPVLCVAMKCEDYLATTTTIIIATFKMMITISRVWFLEKKRA
ncbi:hypothetical protein DH2020_011199 [Rehmannia glutinosa]|uniref:RING-type E3 ubiquitin transferase n=1 Tax=Rehmannia glutinosa TaxID=99300 RepID=A0ABR0XCU4_REHGL